MNLLITGAASGIGTAVADYFIERGHIIYGIDVAKAIERENFHGYLADITDENGNISKNISVEMKSSWMPF